jgi:hypothetical protein
VTTVWKKTVCPLSLNRRSQALDIQLVLDSPGEDSAKGVIGHGDLAALHQAGMDFFLVQTLGQQAFNQFAACQKFDPGHIARNAFFTG